jgi:signal transduction histidine kinase
LSISILLPIPISKYALILSHHPETNKVKLLWGILLVLSLPILLSNNLDFWLITYGVWLIVIVILSIYITKLLLAVTKTDRHETAVIPFVIGMFGYLIAMFAYVSGTNLSVILRADEMGFLLFLSGLSLSYIQRLMDLQQNFKRISNKIVTIAEEERHSLARELHDGISQQLAAIRLQLQMQASIHKIPLDTISSELLNVINEMNRTVHGLRPLMLEKHGLVKAIESIIHDLQNTCKSPIIQCYLDDIDVPMQTSQHLFRIFQECTQNAIKYAEANIVTVTLSRYKKGLSLCIYDDGKGICQSPNKQSFRGLGTINIQERVSLMDGHLSIQSSAEKGTFIQINITDLQVSM